MRLAVPVVLEQWARLKSSCLSGVERRNNDFTPSPLFIAPPRLPDCGAILFVSLPVVPAYVGVTAAAAAASLCALCSFSFSSYRHIEEDGNADALDTAEDDGEQARGQSAANMFLSLACRRDVGMEPCRGHPVDRPVPFSFELGLLLLLAGPILTGPGTARRACIYIDIQGCI